MNPSKIEKEVKTAAIVSPIVLALGAAALAGAGHLQWAVLLGMAHT